MEITSNQNTTYKQWMKLHQAKYRSEYRRFLVEGEHLVEEALKAKCVEAIIIRYGHKTSYKGTIYELKDNLFDKLCVTQSKENIIALCTFSDLKVKNETRILICDQIQDPGNMGTMIRTALSFGFDKILCSKDCVDVYNEKVIRASQGAMFHIVTESVDCIKSIEDLKKRYVCNNKMEDVFEINISWARHWSSDKILPDKNVQMNNLVRFIWDKFNKLVLIDNNTVAEETYPLTPDAVSTFIKECGEKIVNGFDAVTEWDK